MKMFRLLRADEIEVRVQSVKSNGCVVLLYKDARCDMNILDETIGAKNWQRSHEVINGNLFCNVGINFGEDYGEEDRWVWKQDVGVESNTEKEKGQASDSFKRACFNWGIGRELYTAPFIWIALKENEIVNGKCYAKFSVKEIGYNKDEEIEKLVIIDEKGEVRFDTDAKKKSKKKETKKEEQVKEEVEDQVDYRKMLVEFCKNNKIDMNELSKKYCLNRNSTQQDFQRILTLLGGC